MELTSKPKDMDLNVWNAYQFRVAFIKLMDARRGAVGCSSGFREECGLSNAMPYSDKDYETIWDVLRDIQTAVENEVVRFEAKHSGVVSEIEKIIRANALTHEEALKVRALVEQSY
jgi:hypothetical protein